MTSGCHSTSSRRPSWLLTILTKFWMTMTKTAELRRTWLTTNQASGGKRQQRPRPQGCRHRTPELHDDPANTKQRSRKTRRQDNAPPIPPNLARTASEDTGQAPRFGSRQQPQRKTEPPPTIGRQLRPPAQPVSRGPGIWSTRDESGASNGELLQGLLRPDGRTGHAVLHLHGPATQ